MGKAGDCLQILTNYGMAYARTACSVLDVQRVRLRIKQHQRELARLLRAIRDLRFVPFQVTGGNGVDLWNTAEIQGATFRRGLDVIPRADRIVDYHPDPFLSR